MAVELKQVLVDKPYEPAETANQTKRLAAHHWRIALPRLVHKHWRLGPLCLLVLAIAIASAAFNDDVPLQGPGLSQLPLLLLMTEKPVHHPKQ